MCDLWKCVCALKTRGAVFQCFLLFQNFLLFTKIPSQISVSSGSPPSPSGLSWVGRWRQVLANPPSAFPRGRRKASSRDPAGTRAPGTRAPTWTGASGCSSVGVPPHSGATSASPPGPPSLRTCGRPRRGHAPRPPPQPLRHGTETPHPLNPIAWPPPRRPPSRNKQKEPNVGYSPQIYAPCVAAAKTAATGYQATARQPVTRETRLRLLPALISSKFPPTRSGFSDYVIVPAPFPAPGDEAPPAMGAWRPVPNRGPPLLPPLLKGGGG